MSELIEKLSYHIEMIGRTIDHQSYPIEALVLSMNWNRTELENVFKFFEDWEIKRKNNATIDSAPFESDFTKRFNLNYQGLKPVILAFWRNGQWTELCEAYVDSFGKSASIEYSEIVNRKP